MKRRNTRILSLLTVICMIAGILLVPGKVPVANAAETGVDITKAIPTATEYYVNNDFEQVNDDGSVDITGVSFNQNGDTNIAEVRSNNHYITFTKGGENNPQISYSLTEGVSSIVLQVALSRKENSGAIVKFNDTALLEIGEDGTITSGSTVADSALAVDTFTTFTISVNSSENTYALWIGDTQVVQYASIGDTALGNVTGIVIELTGDAANSPTLFVDDVKIYRAKQVYYSNDFSQNADGITFGNTVSTDTVTTSASITNGLLYLEKSGSSSNSSSNPVSAYWNADGAVATGISKQVVVSFDVSYDTAKTFGNGSVYLVGENGAKAYVTWVMGGNSVLKGVYGSSTGSATYKDLGSIYASRISRKVTLALDFERGTFTAYLDGTQSSTITDVPLYYSTAGQSIDRLQSIEFCLSAAKTAGNDATITFDNLQIYDGTAYIADPTEIVSATEIPEVLESYIDNSFETKDPNGVSELSGLVLNANGDENSATVPVVDNNHYAYLETFDGTNGGSRIWFNAGTTRSDYTVISMDVAYTKDMVDSAPVRMYVDGAYTVNIRKNGALTWGSGSSTGKTVPKGEFVNITMVFDYTKDTYALWYAGKYVMSVSWDRTMTQYIYIHLPNVNHNLLIDNVKVYSYTPELAFSGASLTLENNLAIQFNANASMFGEGMYSDPYAVFSFNGKDYTVTDYTVTDTGKYAFQFSNIAPHQIGDTVTATLYATCNGETVSSEPVEYSVLTYCTNKLAAEDSSASLKTLLVDLLNYGAAAQTYRGYKTDSLVNADADRTLASTGDTLESHLNTATATVENPAATWKSATLVLENAVTVRLKLKAESIEGLTVQLTAAGNTWTTADFVDTGLGDNTYYIYFNGLHAGQMSEVINATIYSGDTAVSNTLSYSIETYAYNKQDVKTDSLGDLVKAMMKYGDSAAAFTG